MTSPEHRQSLVGHEAAETFLADMLHRQKLSNGWMICGPAGIGKATLAYRLAKAVLAGSESRSVDSLGVAAESQAARLVSQKAHPDLFVAERAWDEKKERYATEITVDTIRNLISFMGQTSGGYGRVAIVDAADHLNRNAANALLKVLEEPPATALLILLCNAPGRLLPTIRSRCRRLNLQPVATGEIAAFLEAEGAAKGEEAQKLASLSSGRPGFALSLAVGDGAAAIALVEDFLSRVAAHKGVHELAQKLSPVAAAPLWQTFRDILLQYLTETARAGASGGNCCSPSEPRGDKSGPACFLPGPMPLI